MIKMEAGSVGRVLGRGGETMRRIEAETQAKVQFIPGRYLSYSFKLNEPRILIYSE